MNEDRKVSSVGLELITKEEGVVLHVYKDQIGLLTVGVGHLLTPEDKRTGRFNNGITREQAIELLKQDIVKTQNEIKKYVKVELNQNQFDALASMIFNTGPGPVVTGTLGKLLNAGNFSDVPGEMMKWCHAGGKVLPVLQRRRKTEAALFQKKMEYSPAVIVIQTEKEPIQIIHPNMPLPEPEPTLPDNDVKLKLTSWQKVQNSFFKLFR